MAAMDEIIDLLSSDGVLANDTELPYKPRSSDLNDNYLIALAISARSIIVTGNLDLLALSNKIPVISPGSFLETILNTR